MTAREQIMEAMMENFPAYAEEFLRIRTKTGDILPFAINDAQAYLHKRLEDQRAATGKVRAVILKGRQQGCCLDPNTKVLTSDLNWVPLKSLKVGHELVACDEQPTEGRGTGTRRMRTSVVEKIWKTRRPAFRVTFDDGRSVICSAEHRWLSRKTNVQPKWRSIGGTVKDGRDGLKVGDTVRSITSAPWGRPDLDDAWFGGMIDGEGSFDFLKRTGADLAVSQRSGPVLDRMLAHCAARGYTHCVVSDDGPRKTQHGQQPVHAISISGMPNLFRLMGLSRPVRFIGARWWEGKRMPDNGWRTITEILPLGTMSLMDIQTSTQTYVAEGLISHNSTYVNGRFYHRTTTSPGVRTFIMAHEADASSNLFGMVDRFHQKMPDAFRPHTGASNAKELIFDVLDSGYRVATAGSKDAGRSATVQFFHGSEVAFWPNADEHGAGILQAVPDVPGTEVIFESTANGVGNYFHKQWLKAMSGQSDFIAIFIPWFWQKEYAAPVPDGFQIEHEELEYMQAYKLTLEQMAWRRKKIIDLGDPKLFMQEYPATPDEAFQTTGIESFIPADVVMKARKKIPGRGFGAVVAGFDPKRDGSDRASFLYRQGDQAWGLEYNGTRNFTQTLGFLQSKLDAEMPYIEMLFIDHGGSGWELGQMLAEQGYGQRVRVVNFGSGAKNDGVYSNRRAEMWGAMKGWLMDANHTPTIPDDDALSQDLCAPSFEYDARTRIKLEPKDKMKGRLNFSPDGADALALTFAEPLIRHHVHADAAQAIKARVDEHPFRRA